MSTSRDKTSQEPGDKICGNCVSQLVRPPTYSFYLVRSKKIYILYGTRKEAKYFNTAKMFFQSREAAKLPFENKRYFTLDNLSTYYGHITLRFCLSVGIFTGLFIFAKK